MLKIAFLILGLSCLNSGNCQSYDSIPLLKGIDTMSYTGGFGLKPLIITTTNSKPIIGFNRMGDIIQFDTGGDTSSRCIRSSVKFNSNGSMVELISPYQRQVYVVENEIGGNYCFGYRGWHTTYYLDGKIRTRTYIDSLCNGNFLIEVFPKNSRGSEILEISNYKLINGKAIVQSTFQDSIQKFYLECKNGRRKKTIVLLSNEPFKVKNECALKPIIFKRKILKELRRLNFGLYEEIYFDLDEDSCIR